MIEERSLSSWCVSLEGHPTKPDYTWRLVADIPWPAEVAIPLLRRVEAFALDLLRRELPTPRRGADPATATP